MKGRYVLLATKFWTDEKIINLDTETKLLYLYMLSSPHSNMAGYYRLPKAYIKADLHLSDKGFTKGFNKLLKKGLIKYCDKSSVILVLNYYKYNKIQNENQAKGAANRTSELPQNSLVEEYKKVVKRFADNHKKELLKGLPKGFDKGLSITESESESDSEPESETDNNSCSDSENPNDFKFDEDTKPYKTAVYLRSKILDNNARQPVPDENPKDLEDWAVELDRLNRLGTVGAKDKGYSWEEIYNIIDWCQDDSFWKKNIKSAGKLREQVVKLEDNMPDNRKTKENKIEKNYDDILDL